ncbi:Tfp pilus assembly protein PilF [Luteimonas cucumeris]|uniref:Tfp pilus assembly protein PilF n=1 Tax=Luteimonas cucumeris TaxID=985012 RepID=A0A562LFD7_9GAMM|nr:sulfotransferase [Luteimonas cucumeris]TWI06328.1 Tfp pilus assembly protein PilF [Luteimonas cucumeris]
MTQSNTQIRDLLMQAESQAAQKDWPRAIESYEAVLRLRPGDANVLVQLSYVHSLAGHYRTAREYALQAAAAKPDEPRVLKELIARLRTFNEAGALHDCIARLPPLERVGIPLLLAFAAQLSYLNEQDHALMFLDEAKRADPGYPATLLARSQVLTYLGRFDEAEEDLQRVLARAPEIAQTYWLLSRLRKQQPEANHVDAIRRQLARPGRNADEIALLANALHKELDDLGDYEGAWLALEQACRAKRSRLNYRIEESRVLVDRLIELPTPPRAPSFQAIEGVRVPVFIIGMHRSGTTLLEQLLDGHGDVRGVGELYDFTSQMRNATDHHCRGVIDATIVERARGIDYAAVGAGYLKGMEWRLGKEPCFTDKLPSNFLNAGFICRALPQARLLHMVRDPIETCFSNLRELFSDANPYSYDLIELADFHRQYQRLMAHWHEAYPGRILDVDYARLTREPEAVMREVMVFCGLPYQPEMLELQRRSRGVATASAVQVRDKVTAREQPKWLPYQDKLRPLIDALGVS